MGGGSSTGGEIWVGSERPTKKTREEHLLLSGVVQITKADQPFKKFAGFKNWKLRFDKDSQLPIRKSKEDYGWLDQRYNVHYNNYIFRSNKDDYAHKIAMELFCEQLNKEYPVNLDDPEEFKVTLYDDVYAVAYDRDFYYGELNTFDWDGFYDDLKALDIGLGRNSKYDTHFYDLVAINKGLIHKTLAERRAYFYDNSNQKNKETTMHRSMHRLVEAGSKQGSDPKTLLTNIFKTAINDISGGYHMISAPSVSEFSNSSRLTLILDHNSPLKDIEKDIYSDIARKVETYFKINAPELLDEVNLSLSYSETDWFQIEINNNDYIGVIARPIANIFSAHIKALRLQREFDSSHFFQELNQTCGITGRIDNVRLPPTGTINVPIVEDAEQDSKSIKDIFERFAEKNADLFTGLSYVGRGAYGERLKYRVTFDSMRLYEVDPRELAREFKRDVEAAFYDAQLDDNGSFERYIPVEDKNETIKNFRFLNDYFSKEIEDYKSRYTLITIPTMTRHGDKAIYEGVWVFDLKKDYRYLNIKDILIDQISQSSGLSHTELDPYIGLDNIQTSDKDYSTIIRLEPMFLSAGDDVKDAIKHHFRPSLLKVRHDYYNRDLKSHVTHFDSIKSDWEDFYPEIAIKRHGSEYNDIRVHLSFDTDIKPAVKLIERVFNTTHEEMTSKYTDNSPVLDDFVNRHFTNEMAESDSLGFDFPLVWLESYPFSVDYMFESDVLQETKSRIDKIFKDNGLNVVSKDDGFTVRKVNKSKWGLGDKFSFKENESVDNILQKILLDI